MENPLSFESGTNHVSSPGLTPGIISYQQLCEKTQDIKSDEILISFGLSEDEIKLYKNFQNGIDYVNISHKNIEESVLYELITNIKQKIKKGELNTSSEERLKDMNKFKEPIKDNFISNKSILRHPVNDLHTITDDLFGHLDVDERPSVNKRRKLARRLQRKLDKPIPIPEPKSYTKTISNVSNFNETTTSWKTAWDVKDIEIPKQTNFHAKNNIKTKKIGCSSQTLYTIKNNTIVRLETTPENSLQKFKFSEMKIPINKAEEKILEGTKLTIVDIKCLPRFENYSSGQPSKVLFVKNLSNNVKEDDLIVLFREYHNCTDIRLMTGKMKGQAFITFNCLDTATRALHEKNGIIVKGRPMILQFGKQCKR